MRTIAGVIFVMTGAVGLIGSALAADMTGAEIKSFLSGKTVYLETTAASASGKAGQGVIYWSEDGTALYKTPASRWGPSNSLRGVEQPAGHRKRCQEVSSLGPVPHP